MFAMLLPPCRCTTLLPAQALCDEPLFCLPCSWLLQKLTFLRMGDMMIDNWSAFGAFLQRLTCPP